MILKKEVKSEQKLDHYFDQNWVTKPIYKIYNEHAQSKRLNSGR